MVNNAYLSLAVVVTFSLTGLHVQLNSPEQYFPLYSERVISALVPGLSSQLHVNPWWISLQ